MNRKLKFFLSAVGAVALGMGVIGCQQTLDIRNLFKKPKYVQIKAIKESFKLEDKWAHKFLIASGLNGNIPMAIGPIINKTPGMLPDVRGSLITMIRTYLRKSITLYVGSISNNNRIDIRQLISGLNLNVEPKAVIWGEVAVFAENMESSHSGADLDVSAGSLTKGINVNANANISKNISKITMVVNIANPQGAIDVAKEGSAQFKKVNIMGETGIFIGPIGIGNTEGRTWNENVGYAMRELGIFLLYKAVGEHLCVPYWKFLPSSYLAYRSKKGDEAAVISKEERDAVRECWESFYDAQGVRGIESVLKNMYGYDGVCIDGKLDAKETELIDKLLQAFGITKKVGDKELLILLLENYDPRQEGAYRKLNFVRVQPCNLYNQTKTTANKTKKRKKSGKKRHRHIQFPDLTSL